VSISSYHVHQPNPHYQRVRVAADGQRYLQCHSRGAREYSPFNCPLEALGTVRSIEDHYQTTKVFELPTGELQRVEDWRQAKDYQKAYRKAPDTSPRFHHFELRNGVQLGTTNLQVTDLVIQWYIALWHKYLRKNPELIAAAQGYDGYEDIFEGNFPFSQAKVIAQCVSQGIESLYPMYAELRIVLQAA
jgi:hypothetical protein